MVWLLGGYSDAYVSNQCRALQQFFKWWAEWRSNSSRTRWPACAHRRSKKLVPVFTSGELSRLEKTCQSRTFAQRRDTAIVTLGYSPFCRDAAGAVGSRSLGRGFMLVGVLAGSLRGCGSRLPWRYGQPGRDPRFPEVSP
jgi:hypothetical protein